MAASKSNVVMPVPVRRSIRRGGGPGAALATWLVHVAPAAMVVLLIVVVAQYSRGGAEEDASPRWVEGPTLGPDATAVDRSPPSFFVDSSDRGDGGSTATDDVRSLSSRRTRLRERDSALQDPATQPVDVTSVSTFLRSGGRLPVAVIAHDRPDLLNQTLTSLLSARGVRREAVVVLQHGSHAGVAAVGTAFGVTVHRSFPRPDLWSTSPADILGANIAHHYKLALTYMFDEATTVSVPRGCCGGTHTVTERAGVWCRRGCVSWTMVHGVPNVFVTTGRHPASSSLRMTCCFRQIFMSTFMLRRRSW